MRNKILSIIIVFSLCSANICIVNANQIENKVRRGEFEKEQENNVKDEEKEQKEQENNVKDEEKEQKEQENNVKDEEKEQKEQENNEKDKKENLLNFNLKSTGEDVSNNIKTLIKQFYIGFYEREADINGLEYWKNEIFSKKRTVAEVLECFINSTECKNKNYNNEEYVKSLYIALQGRNPDEGGLVYWKNELEKGQSRKVVLYNVFNSNEFQDKLDSMGIENKGQVNLDLEDNGGKIRRLISQFYVGFYGREGDKEGITYWTSQIIDKKKSIAEILLVFYNSNELKNKNYTDEEFIDCIYIALFNEVPNTGEKDCWMKKISEGNSRKYVLALNLESK